MPTGKSLQRRIQRMRKMDGAEFQDRSRQFASQRLDAVRLWLGHDWKQTLNSGAVKKTGHFFFEPQAVPQLIAILRERLPLETEAIVRRAEKILEHSFDLLGYEDVNYGSAINWHLDKIHGKQAPRRASYRVKYLDFSEVGDSKVTWELNRHQHFVLLAKAYLLTGDQRFAQEILEQWQDWRKQNPYPTGINWTSSLEVAFRSLSWLWVRALLLDSSALPPAFWEDMTQALAVSGRHLERYLSTYFSPNTHLLGEAMALLYIGVLCPEIQKSSHWRDMGWRILIEEIHNQVRDDGFYFEQSVHYHVYSLEFFLQSGLLAAKNDLETPRNYSTTVEKMCVVLALLSRTGISASFGDDDGGRLFDGHRNRAEHLTDPLATAAVVFGRGDFKSLVGGLREDMIWLLGQDGVAQFDELSPVAPSLTSTALVDSGIYCMSSAGTVPQQMIVDAGPQGAGSAGHGHADALSIQLLYGNRALLQDPGTFEYVGPAQERDVLRSTAAHSTLVIDGQGQSQPKGPFGWERFTQSCKEAWVAGEMFDLLRASHDGYASIGITHRRWVFHLRGRFWLVRDAVQGAGRHTLDINWHLGPKMEPGDSENRFFAQENPHVGVALVSTEGNGWKRELQPSWFSPAYGVREESWMVRFRCEAQLPAECVTLVLPLAERGQSSGSLRSSDDAENPEVSSYLYELGDEQHGFFFRRESRPWFHKGWASDAEFLYYRADSNGLRDIFFYEGSYVEVGGKRLVSSNGTVPYCQLVTQGDRTQVLSPSSERILLHEPLNEAVFGPDVALTSAGSRKDRKGN